LAQGAAATAAVLAGSRQLAAAAKGPSVVIVRDKTKRAITDHKVDAAVVQRLVDRAVMTLAGRDDIAQAWATFVKPKERVAVKFNGLFPRATTHPEVVAAVTNGLVRAGVDPANIVVYDRDNRAFRTARIPVSREGAGPRAYPTARDYGPSVKAGPVGTNITNILHKADALINLPMMKTHNLAGVTGALKNHLGTVPNASAFHRESCRYIAELNALEPIRAKTRICICDGLYGLYNRGPGYNSRFRWDYHGIMAATDPVALDATLADIIRAKRVENGMSPYERPVVHLARAVELGLGVADLAKINRVELDV